MEGAADGNESPAPEGNVRQSLLEYVSGKRLDAGIFLLRLSTVVHGFLAAFPLLLSPAHAYQRCLISYVGVSAFRLSQRVTGLGLNSESMQRIFGEDSGHYLLYCLIFAMQPPGGIVFLMPIILFSLLHSITYIRKLNEATGVVPGFVQQATAYISARQQQLLMAAANTEIIIMVMIIMAVFGGTFGIFVPFMYYRFLSMRYSSQRNPYCRHAFTNMRMLADYGCAHPSCPALVQRAIQAVVRTVERLAPQQPAA